MGRNSRFLSGHFPVDDRQAFYFIGFTYSLVDEESADKVTFFSALILADWRFGFY